MRKVRVNVQLISAVVAVCLSISISQVQASNSVIGHVDESRKFDSTQVRTTTDYPGIDYDLPNFMDEVPQRDEGVGDVEWTLFDEFGITGNVQCPRMETLLRSVIRSMTNVSK